MDSSDLGAFLMGVGPIVGVLAVIIILALVIRRAGRRAARRRHGRHDYKGYVSYNPRSVPRYLRSAHLPTPGEETSATSPKPAEPGEPPKN